MFQIPAATGHSARWLEASYRRHSLPIGKRFPLVKRGKFAHKSYSSLSNALTIPNRAIQPLFFRIDLALPARYEIATSGHWSVHADLPTEMLDLQCVVHRDPEILAAEADKDLVMVSITNGFYYAVSDVAREIWEAIERPRKVSDLIDDLAKSYNIDPATCQAETLSFLEDLRSEGLLKVTDGSGS